MARRDLEGVLARAQAALEQGRGVEVARQLTRELRAPGLRREEELAIRTALAEAWLLQDDVRQASLALGRPPDARREPLEAGRLSALWRMHGRVAAALGEQSRAIALLGRALTQANRAHEARAIGLAHYELGLCYRLIGDTATVRDHLTRAASALHAAGDRRALALVHSLSGVTLAQDGRFDEAMVALRQAERIATLAQADDVLATVCGNQANVALMKYQHEEALALAERSVLLNERGGSPHGLGVSLATLGQICVRVGDVDRAEQVLQRALEARSSIQFRETTGAVFDSLAQIHMMRGTYETAADYLREAREAYGEFGQLASYWYDWSIRVLEARLALHRGAFDEALSLATGLLQSPGVPATYARQADLIAAAALLAAGRHADADQRLVEVGARLEQGTMPGVWGEYVRLRGEVHAQMGRATEAYHDLSQSVSIFELLGERYNAGLSRLALGKLAARAGARSKAERYLAEAAATFEALGAVPVLEETRATTASASVGTGEYLGSPLDGDDVIVRRVVDAAALPELLSRETVAAMLEACDGGAAVLFAQPTGADVRVVAHAGCDFHAARALARAAGQHHSYRGGPVLVEPVGYEHDGPLIAALAGTSGFGAPAIQRFRMLAAVARQGFELRAARDRPLQPADPGAGRALETLLPGFICTGAVMSHLAAQIERLQGTDLTVLITGESGTGKELVARAIHVGSPRSAAIFLPYNCTTTTRELADSQLFGHRRGSFTGAVADQPGLFKSAAGGTLFLDEIGDLPLDVQPKLLRFLEQGEILPVGDTRPQRIELRVIAATNTDLEQRVAEGKFREDLFYRLNVIRIHVSPLRDRRDEIPHLSTFFLREACEETSKPDVRLSAETLNLFADYAWPGNVRQLRNEIRRAVAMSPPGGTIRAEHLSPELAGLDTRAADYTPPQLPGRRAPTLAAAVEQLERDLIVSALERSAGNISQTARALGLTRRGLYLKLQRLGLETRQIG